MMCVVGEQSGQLLHHETPQHRHNMTIDTHYTQQVEENQLNFKSRRHRHRGCQGGQYKFIMKYLWSLVDHMCKFSSVSRCVFLISTLLGSGAKEPGRQANPQPKGLPHILEVRPQIIANHSLWKWKQYPLYLGGITLCKPLKSCIRKVKTMHSYLGGMHWKPLILWTMRQSKNLIRSQKTFFQLWLPENFFEFQIPENFFFSSGFQNFEGMINWAFLLLAMGGIRLFLENINKSE